MKNLCLTEECAARKVKVSMTKHKWCDRCRYKMWSGPVKKVTFTYKTLLVQA